jgi:hypothetical protein
MSDEAALLPVRATIHLQRLHAGQMALVDPSDPYIAGLLEAEYLVSLKGGSPDARARIASTVSPSSAPDEDVDG